MRVGSGGEKPGARHGDTGREDWGDENSKGAGNTLSTRGAGTCIEGRFKLKASGRGYSQYEMKERRSQEGLAAHDSELGLAKSTTNVALAYNPSVGTH